jgi:hypothetical protein
MVSNIAIESKLEKLGRQRLALEPKLAGLEAQRGSCELAEQKARDEHTDASSELNERRGKLDSLITAGVRDGKELGQAAISHQVSLARMEAADIANRKAREKREEMDSKREKLTAAIEKVTSEEDRLRPLTKIRRLDVEPDKILTATKLALSLLLTFSIREYLPAMAMASQTFLSRVLCLSGRREIFANQETVIFYDNPRDPEVNDALRAACEILNKRHLTRDGRSLHYRVDRALVADKG